MKNMKWSQLNMIFGFLAGTALILTIIGFVFGKDEWESNSISSVTTMNESWIVRSNELYDMSTDLPCNLETQVGEAATLSHFLPDDLPSDAGIAFHSVYNAVQVKVGEEIVYQYGVNETQPFVKSPVPKWILIPLDTKYAGKLITITLVSNYGPYSGFFTDVELGSVSGLLYKHWLTDGISVLLSVILILLTIGLVIVTLISGLYKQVDYRLVYFILLSALTVLWSVSGCSVISMQSSHAFGLWVLHMMTRILLPIIYLIFIRGFAQKKRLVSVIDIGVILSSVAAVVVLILQLLHLSELAVTYEILCWIYRAGFVAYTAIFFVEWIKKERFDLTGIALAQVGLVVAGIINFFVKPAHMRQEEGAFWLISVIVFLFVLLGIMVTVLIGQVDRKVLEVEEGFESQRALAVKMMNPNFLFSTLNSMLTMAKENNRQTPRMVYALSKYLRSNLDAVREEKLIPFEEELAHISAYLEIQQLRLSGFEAQVEDKYHDFSVPNRSIEAIVENAVKHGIEKNNGQGKVVVRSYERRDSYAIQIIDEGIGFDTDLLYKKSTPTSMKTVRDRLIGQIDASVEVTSKPGTGTIVAIKLPKKRKNKKTNGTEE